MSKNLKREPDKSDAFFNHMFKNPNKIETGLLNVVVANFFMTVFILLSYLNAIFVVFAIPIAWYIFYSASKKTKAYVFDIANPDLRLSIVLMCAAVWVTLTPGALISWAFRMRAETSFNVFDVFEVGALAVMVNFLISAGAIVISTRRLRAYLDENSDQKMYTFRRKVSMGLIKKDVNRPIRKD
ncbi:MAG: hypothetical protein ACSHXY_09895 [Alphaproteobacteria bacterium]